MLLGLIEVRAMCVSNVHDVAATPPRRNVTEPLYVRRTLLKSYALMGSRQKWNIENRKIEGQSCCVTVA